MTHKNLPLSSAQTLEEAFVYRPQPFIRFQKVPLFKKRCRLFDDLLIFFCVKISLENHCVPLFSPRGLWAHLRAHKKKIPVFFGESLKLIYHMGPSGNPPGKIHPFGGFLRFFCSKHPNNPIF